MKKLYIVLLTITFVFSHYSCKKDKSEDLVGNWTKRSPFQGAARNGAVSFCIGNEAYVGLGDNGNKYFLDFYKYNAEQNLWTQVDSFPGQGRSYAVAFSVNGKGYVGTGWDGDNYLRDFWEYDPALDTFIQKKNFAGAARHSAVAFAVGGKGYVGTGYDDRYLSDFWSYDPATDSWSSINFPGDKRMNAVAFVIGSYGYVCTGIYSGTLVNDFYRYDPSNNTWSALSFIDNSNAGDFDDGYAIKRSNAVGFATESKGYVVTGLNSSILKDAWEYDPSTDRWKQRTGLEGSARMNAVGFSIGNRLFVGTGSSSAYQLEDLWEFKPEEAYDQYK